MPRIGRSRPVSAYRPNMVAEAFVGIPPMAASTVTTADLSASASVTAHGAATTTTTAALTATATRTISAAATTTVTAALVAAASRTAGIAAEATTTAMLTASASLQGLANGHIIRRGQSPLMIIRNGVPAIAVYYGSRLIWDCTRPVIVRIPTAQGTAFMPAPSIITGASAAIPPMMAAASMPEPTAIVNARVVIPVMSATASMPTPTVVIPADTHIPVMSATASMPTPGVLITDTAIGQAPVMTATAFMPAPTAVVNAGVAVPPMTATAFMPAPTAGIQTSVVIPPMTATASMPTPTPATGATTVIPPALASAFMLPPTVAAGANIIIPPMTATGTMPAPTIATTMSIEDDFLRAGPALGANWTTIGFAPVISGSCKVQGGTNGPSSTTTIYAAYHNTPLTTASQEVSVVASWPSPFANWNQTGQVGGFLRSDTSGNRVFFGGSGSTAFIGTVIGVTRTTRLTVTHSQANGVSIINNSRVGCRAVGNVYELILDGIPSGFTWTDSGNLVSQGNRHFGIEVRNTENGSGTASYGFGIFSVRAHDYDGTNELLPFGTWVQPSYGNRASYSGFGPYVGGAITNIHVGVDVVNAIGTPIYAACAGTVDIAGTLPTTFQNGGTGVRINHGNDITTEYMHMNSVSVSAGATVTAGQQIGTMGNTGDTTGTHLHFQVLRTTLGRANDYPPRPNWINPERWLAYNGVTLNWPTDPF
jgi:murein DD-endopeptidase MepM/ murein hydrolase activator NlpD